MSLWHIDDELELHPVGEFTNSHLDRVEIDEHLIAQIYRNKVDREHIEMRLKSLQQEQKFPHRKAGD